MARGRGRGKRGNSHWGNNHNFASKRKDYQEYGESHPIDDIANQNTLAKRQKIWNTEEKRSAIDTSTFCADDDDNSSDGDTADSALTRLLATFGKNGALEVDDDDSSEGEEEETGEGDEETSEGETDEGEQGDADTNELELEEVDMSDVEQDDEVKSDGQITDSDGRLLERNTGIHAEKLSKKENAQIDKRKFEHQIDGDDESDDGSDSEIGEPSDPFCLHFERNLSAVMAEQISDSKSWLSEFSQWPKLGRVKLELPQVEIDSGKAVFFLGDTETVKSPNIGIAPMVNEDLTMHMKKSLRNNLSSVSLNGVFSQFQQELLSVLSNYSDFYYPESTHEKWNLVRGVYTLHAVNHVLKTHATVLRHNTKVNRTRRKKHRKESDVNTYRDQGFSRPKVLILVPFKNCAFRIIETVIALLFPSGPEGGCILNLKRFKEDFGDVLEEENLKRPEKPEDFEEIFRGDIKEDFKIGFSLTRKSLKLYTEFYKSDIIVASPLGLRLTVGTPDEHDSNSDFLSSIEVLIIDQADIMVMQNWEHLLLLREAMNRLPTDVQQLQTDLNRVRLWSLEGHAPMYRQTIVFASVPEDHNRALVAKCSNFTGRVQVVNPIQNGSAQNVIVNSELILHRIQGIRDPDTRFNYFTKEVLPHFRTGLRKHTMIYVPDYCDYVRLVRYFKEDGGSNISSINEYMVGQNSKVASARCHFFEGKRQFILYTERFHFYRRYRIKGVRNIIFYSLPTYPHFFSEICNFMVASLQNPREKYSGTPSVTVLYQISDATLLAGVLGSKRAGEVLRAEKAVHMCVIGN